MLLKRMHLTALRVIGGLKEKYVLGTQADP